jgi:hypothetical protein
VTGAKVNIHYQRFYSDFIPPGEEMMSIWKALKKRRRQLKNKAPGV